MISFCNDDDDSDSSTEYEDFIDQAPKQRATSRGPAYIPPLRENSVRANLILPDVRDEELIRYFEQNPIDASDVYHQWLTAGVICTRRARGPCRFRYDEYETLMDTYQYALKLGAEASQFQDAIVDAMAEVFDDYYWRRRWKELFDATEGYPHCPMRRLWGFLFVMNTLPDLHYLEESGKPEFVEYWEAELKQLLKGKMYREIWEEYITSGRCKFHEHGEGQCKRVASRGKIVRSVL